MTRLSADIRRFFQETLAQVPETARRPLAVGVPAVLGLTVVAALAVPYPAKTEAPGTMRQAQVPTTAPAATVTPAPAAAAPTAPKTAAPAPAPAVAAPAAPAPKTAPAPATTAAPRSEALGFYVNWDKNSFASLERNIDQMTVFSPEWLHLGSNGRLSADNPAEQARVTKYIRERNPKLKITPIVNNLDMASKRWNPDQLAVLLADPKMRNRIADDIIASVRKSGYDGVNIDFEGLHKPSREHLSAFMQVLWAKAHPLGLEVSVDVMAGGSVYDMKTLANNSDYVIPMMYNEHTHGTRPGPITSQGWYTRQMNKLFSEVAPSKVVIALGAYNYDWTDGTTYSKALTFGQAMKIARANKSVLKLEQTSLNTTFAYPGKGRWHRVWLLDAASAFNQISAVSKSKPRGYAVWRLGSEDSKVWRVLADRDHLSGKTAQAIEGPGRTVRYDGKSGLIVSQRIAP